MVLRNVAKLIAAVLVALMVCDETMVRNGWFPVALICWPWIVAALLVAVILVKELPKAWAKVKKNDARRSNDRVRGDKNRAKRSVRGSLSRIWDYVEVGYDVLRNASASVGCCASRFIALSFKTAVGILAVGGALVALQILKSRLDECDWGSMVAFAADCSDYVRSIGSLECWKSSWPVLFVIVWVCVWFAKLLLSWIIQCARMFMRKVGRWLKGENDACKCESDRPLGERDEDRLTRGAYVRTIASLLRGAIRNEPQYIGLYGRWGEGKTSILSLLQKEVRYEGFAFVCFRLWEYADRKELPRLLFDQIARQEKLKTDTSLAGLIRSFGRTLMLDRGDNALSAIPFVGTVLSEWHKSAFGHDAIREGLKEALIRHKERIVVVLDDLDRLLADDIYELLRLIKANGDLPNVSYLVLADREYLAASMAEKLPNLGDELEQRDLGRRYLEKIIPLECNMPPVRQNQYVRLFRELLKSQITDIPDSYRVDGNPFENIAGYLQTMRNVKSLVNAIKVQWAYRRSLTGGSPKIHFGDMADLIAVRMFDRAFYDALVANFYQLRARVKNKQVLDKDGFSRKRVEEVLFANTPKDRRAHLLRFLETVMNFKEYRERTLGGTEGEGEFYYELPASSATAECRLSGPDAFDNYVLADNESIPNARTLSDQFLDFVTARDERYAGDFLVGVWREDEEKLNRLLRNVIRKCKASKSNVPVADVCRALSWTAEVIATQGGRKDFEFNLVSSKNLGSKTLAQINFSIRSLVAIDFNECRRLQMKLLDYWMRNNLLVVAAREVGMPDRTNAFDVHTAKMRELMKFVARKVVDLDIRGKLRGGVEELALRRALAVAALYDKGIARDCVRLAKSDAETSPWSFHALSAFVVTTKRLRGMNGVLLDGLMMSNIFTSDDLNALWERMQHQHCEQTYERAILISLQLMIFRQRQGVPFDAEDCEDAILNELEK